MDKINDISAPESSWVDRHVVIMAGGIGSRFWPVSTPEVPKQFVDILGTGRTLIQMTADRFEGVCPKENLWVVTGSRYVDIVKKQLPQLPANHILAEPVGRGTAPCIAYAGWKIAAENPSANIVFTPSDAYVQQMDIFRRIISSALDFTASGRRIVTLGICPSRPETGYGYICRGSEVPQCSGNDKIFMVESFKEKPDTATAMKYLADGNFFWNAGIFAWSAATLKAEIREFCPSLASIMDTIALSFNTSQEEGRLLELFPKCEKISIDYAVMEKSPRVYVIPSGFTWSDLGTWGSVRSFMPVDEQGNAVSRQNEGWVRLYGCRDCVVSMPDTVKAVVEGLDGYVVAMKDGCLLVCSLENEQNIGKYSQENG